MTLVDDLQQVIGAATFNRDLHADESGGGFSPGSLSQTMFWGADGTTSRTVNGTARLIDRSRSGDPRQMRSGHCFLFDGVADRVEVGDFLDAPTSYSVMCFARVATATDERIIGRRLGAGGWFMGSSGGALRIVHYTGTTDIVSGGTVVTNQWHHFAVTYDGTDVRLYVDGVKVKTQALGTPLTDSDSLWWGEIGTAYYQGFAFDLRASTEVYTDDEIATIAALSLGVTNVGKVPNIAWYKGDDGVQEVATDSSGNGNHGAISSASIALFHNLTGNDVYSFGNEVGFTQSVGLQRTTLGEMVRSNTTDIDSLKFWIQSPDDDRFILFSHYTDGGRYMFGKGAGVDAYISSNSGTITIKVDGVTSTAPSDFQDGGWHEIEITGIDLSTWTGGFRIGYNGSTFRNTSNLHDLRMYDGGVLVNRYFTDRSLNDSEGTDHFESIAASSENFFLSNIPRDESDPTKDIIGGDLGYSGQAPRDATLSSPCGTFDGAGDYIEVGDGTQLDNLSSFSVSFWISPSATFNNDGIVGKLGTGAGNGWMVYSASGALLFYIKDTGLTVVTASTGALTLDEWAHVAATFDGTNMTIYLNGIEKAANTSNPPGSNVGRKVEIGQYNASVATRYQGGLADVRIYEAELSAAEVTYLASGGAGGTAPSTSPSLHLPMCEGAGSVIHDVSGNDYHGVLTAASEAAFWANQQDKTDTLVADGYSIATNYSGSGEYFNKGSRLTSGTLAKLSVCCWVNTSWAATAAVVSEYGGASQAGWQLQVRNTGVLRFLYSKDGTALVYRTTSSAIPKDTWVHIAGVLDSVAGTIAVYVDGVAVASGLVGTPDVALFNTNGPFMINGSNGVGDDVELLRDVVVIEDALTAAEVIGVMGGDVPAAAWRFTDGNGTEYNQGLTALTKNGTPDHVSVPASVFPITVGSGVLAPGQSLDFAGGEDDSPYASQLADILTDLVYDQADDDESDAQFARVQAGGDDRIVTTVPALTGSELTKMQGYTA